MGAWKTKREKVISEILAESAKKHYISITMLNNHFSYVFYALSFVACASLLRKAFALRLLALRTTLR